MSIYLICLVCLIVGGALGAFMGYKFGFTAGELHSLYKGAAAAAKREEELFLRKIERLKMPLKPNLGEEEVPICREENAEPREKGPTVAEIQSLKEAYRKRYCTREDKECESRDIQEYVQELNAYGEKK